MLFLRLTDDFVRVDRKQLQNRKSPTTIEANVVQTKNRNGEYKKTSDAINVTPKKIKKRLTFNIRSQRCFYNFFLINIKVYHNCVTN